MAVKNLKKLLKKKDSNKLHPDGRKFKQLTSAELRHSKLKNLKTQRQDLNKVKLERHVFFKEVVQKTDKQVYTTDEMKEIANQFINRNLIELKRMESERRKGRPKSSKHQQLELVYNAELEEFRSGFNCVDLTCETTVKNLKTWGEDWGGLNVLKMTRV